MSLPRSFQYFAPRTLADARALLDKWGADAKILAGGMSLIPLMKLRLASPSYIIDINRIKELDYVRASDVEPLVEGEEVPGSGRGGAGTKGSLLIGSITTHRTLESSSLVRRDAPLLSETAKGIGDAQVRNLGTIGGALAHSDPSGDLGASVLAMRGKIRVVGPDGERLIPIDEFQVDTFTSSLRERELITEVSVPVPPSTSGSAYLKLERKAGDFATVGVAVQLSLERRTDGKYCTYAGIGLTALGSKNLRANNAEECLRGKELTKEVVAEASTAAAKECSPTDDPLRGSANYKREMARLFTRRAIELAMERAEGLRG